MGPPSSWLCGYLEDPKDRPPDDNGAVADVLFSGHPWHKDSKIHKTIHHQDLMYTNCEEASIATQSVLLNITISFCKRNCTEDWSHIISFSSFLIRGLLHKQWWHFSTQSLQNKQPHLHQAWLYLSWPRGLEGFRKSGTLSGSLFTDTSWSMIWLWLKTKRIWDGFRIGHHCNSTHFNLCCRCYSHVILYNVNI